MRAVRKRAIAMLLCIACLLLTGCWDQKIYEEIGFILQTGLEKSEGGELLYTITLPVITPEMKAKSEVVSTTADLIRQSRENARRTIGKNVESGKAQHIYVSKELAQEGILEYLDVFIRNPANPLLANLLIVEGSPQKLMEASVNFENKPIPAIYVNDLLVEARRSGYTPETRISDYIIKAYSKTIDNIAPLVCYTSKAIDVKGTALFDGDKLVGDIDTRETALLYLLMGEAADIQYIYFDESSGKEEKSGAAILIKDHKRKLDIYTDEDTLKIDIQINLIASVGEYKGKLQLDKKEDLKKLEKEVAKSMEEASLKLIKYMQQVNSDPVGFGEMVRSQHNAYWKTIQWEDIYKDVVFDIKMNLKFELYGAIS